METNTNVIKVALLVLRLIKIKALNLIATAHNKLLCAVYIKIINAIIMRHKNLCVLSFCVTLIDATWFQKSASEKVVLSCAAKEKNRGDYYAPLTYKFCACRILRVITCIFLTGTETIR
uniref:Secreted protein n=1 Tax=Photinus pyralis TaxID=7054 RepID=A0A1Y1KBR3_PHOPY